MTNKEAIEYLQNHEEVGNKEQNEAVNVAIRALRIIDSIEDMIMSEKFWKKHNCCYWVDGECMCGKEYCPDNYTCDYFD